MGTASWASFFRLRNWTQLLTQRMISIKVPTGTRNFYLGLCSSIFLKYFPLLKGISGQEMFAGSQKGRDSGWNFRK